MHIVINMHRDSRGKHRVLSRQGGNARCYAVQSSVANNRRWRISHITSLVGAYNVNRRPVGSWLQTVFWHSILKLIGSGKCVNPVFWTSQLSFLHPSSFNVANMCSLKIWYCERSRRQNYGWPFRSKVSKTEKCLKNGERSQKQRKVSKEQKKVSTKQKRSQKQSKP